MKYKDYYAILGVAKDADAAAIKAAYRKLARKYHPDVSKEAGAEERFKEVAEAYQTLSDAEKRAAYDSLGEHPSGSEFRPPPQWSTRFGDAAPSFDDIDLSDLFANHSAGTAARDRGARSRPLPGEDFEVAVTIGVEEAYHGTTLELNLSMTELDAQGRLVRVPRRVKARIPKGATDGQRLRLRGQGGRGFNGGRDGDLFLEIALRPHPLYRPNGHDLHIDLPLAPWEAALGAAVDVPTLGGTVSLKVPPGTAAGARLRLNGRGLPRPGGDPGDLIALVQIVMPKELSERERELLGQLAQASSFDPRAAFKER